MALREGFPAYADVAVLGAGSAGCVVASRLTEAPGLRCCLVEAGPDYGPYDEGRWPADILEAGADALASHDWGFAGGVASARARIVGGCSAINGCGIVWPSREDLDAWWPEAGWSYDLLEQYLYRAAAQMRSRRSAPVHLEPWRAAFLEAAHELALASGRAFNDPSAPHGAGLIDLNTLGRVRWNAAFAYLDPARHRRNLATTPDTLIDRLVIKGGHATSVKVVRAGVETDLIADTFVLTAGAFASPAILMRSGVGDADSLTRLGISPILSSPAVGSRLLDHPLVDVPFMPSDRLRSETEEFLAVGRPAAQVLLRTEDWALTLGPWLGPEHAGITVVLSQPEAVGKITITSANPTVAPQIDHGFRNLTERDLKCLADGVRLALELGATPPCAELARPQSDLGSGSTLHDWIRASAVTNHHPAGTCRLGPPDEPSSVVDETGRVPGLDNVYVMDASIMPSIPRANVHLTVLAVAERLAETLRQRLSSRPAVSGV